MGLNSRGPSPIVRRTASVLLAGCLLGLLLVGAAVLGYAGHALVASRAKPALFPALAPEALLLPTCALSDGWIARPIDENHRIGELYRGAGSVASRAYYHTPAYEGSWINQTVVWYPTVELAVRDYPYHSRPAFVYHQPWQEMVDWGFDSRFADEQSIECVQSTEGGESFVYRCRYVARYGQYIVTLNMRILSDDLDTEEVRAWLATADRMLIEVR